MNASPFLSVLVIAPPLLVAVILHEIAHGLAAERLGDPTARTLGRITLNPLAHIDPLMTILVPAALIFFHSPIVFGGAKPIPVNPLYFRNPRRGMLWVALAGPAMNVVLAGLSLGCFAIFKMLPAEGMVLGVMQFILLAWCSYGVVINIVLAYFNLLPIPPLDGGRIAVGLLPLRLAKPLSRVEPFGILLVVLLLYAGVFQELLTPVFLLLETLSKHGLMFSSEASLSAAQRDGCWLPINRRTPR